MRRSRPMAAFVGRLRTALREADPDATVTVATGAGRQGVALASPRRWRGPTGSS